MSNTCVSRRLRIQYLKNYACQYSITKTFQPSHLIIERQYGDPFGSCLLLNILSSVLADQAAWRGMYKIEFSPSKNSSSLLMPPKRGRGRGTGETSQEPQLTFQPKRKPQWKSPLANPRAYGHKGLQFQLHACKEKVVVVVSRTWTFFVLGSSWGCAIRARCSFVPLLFSGDNTCKAISIKFRSKVSSFNAMAPVMKITSY